ncbi:MAG: hypothetical protein DWQ29_19700 [Planctomycetota bacterium]|nr:MAG: hypothetical protein DWQ29_19700 [Planctomycetota bacterium]
MDAPEGLAAFLESLHAHDDQAPELSFPARVAPGDDLPRWFNTLPDGDVHLFPDHVVFLTLTESAPGAGLLWKQFASEMRDQLKQLHLACKAAADPGSLLLDAAKWLVRRFKDEDLFARAVMNSNSLFLRREDILGVETGCKWSQGNYIRIATGSQSVSICQNIAGHSDNLVDLVRIGRSMFTKSWQPEFVRLLQASPTGEDRKPRAA